MKKIAVFILSLFMLSGISAQNVKSVGLTDSDVKNWAKNCVSIQKELEKAGIDADEEFSSDMDEKGPAEKILQKYGISKPNSIDKYAMIIQCASILKTESQIDEQTRALLKNMNMDPFAELKENINTKDYDTVAANSKAVLKALEDLEDYTASSAEAAFSSGKYDEDYLSSAYKSLVPDAFDDMTPEEKKLKEEVQKKYNTKKKFKVISSNDGADYIIIQPSDITFKNSSEAEMYAELYTGVSGEWNFCSSCGYLGYQNKPFYTWGSGGVLVYSKFPIDFDTCAPDKFIPDEEVTTAIAKKTVLQMYRYKE